MTIPLVGQDYRGLEGRTGYLLRQAWHAFHGAIETALRPHGLTGAQYGALSILAREGEASGADLARACNTTPQAMNGVLRTLEREGLIGRRPHPTHGRILHITLTSEGDRRLKAARPAVEALEATIEDGLAADQLHLVKGWLVQAAQRLQADAKHRQRAG